MAKANPVKQQHIFPKCVVVDGCVLLGALTQQQIDAVARLIPDNWLIIPCDRASRYTLAYDKPSEVAAADGLTALSGMLKSFGA